MADDTRTLVVRIVGDATSVNRAFSTTARNTKKLGSDLSKAERGVLAGSGVFKGLGRSLAFASGGFLAFGGAAAIVRKTVDAAKEAQVANRQLAQQLKNNGQSFAQYRDQIDKTVLRLSALSGIQDDELKSGLTTILRTVPNVGKALSDLSLATDIARAKGISLSQASLLVAKTEAGNTTLLRRQEFQFKKNATAEQALAKVRSVVAGQARAGTTEQERFGAVLHDTEEIIGTGILPTLNKYLISGTKWLQQMNETGQLQKDVAKISHDFETAIDSAAGAIRTIDKVTGSFKHTLELLIGLKVASSIGRTASSLGLVGSSAEKSAGKVGGLKARLLGLNQVTIAAIAIPIVFEITTRILDKTGATPFLKRGGAAVENLIHPGGDLSISGASRNQELAAIKFAKAELDAGKNIKQVNFDLIESAKFGKLTQDEIDAIVRIAKQAKDSLQGVQVSMEQVTAAAEKVATVTQSTTDATKSKPLTAGQRNTFFDDAVARILRRGGFGDLRQQLSAIDKASSEIKARLAVTKDLTRQLNLQDQLLDLGSQRKGILAQIAQNAKDAAAARKQAAQNAKQAAADAKATRLAQRTARQFRELGLTSTGDERTPQVANLKKRVADLARNITGTNLDTPKLRSELARFRKVLSEGLVPKDVRAKINDLINGISDDLKNNASKNLTKFRHANTDALLAGLGLSPEQTRIARQRLAQVGEGGTVPGSRSASFSGAGAGQPIVVHQTIQLDGRTVATNTTKHQRQATGRRSVARSGPYAGRN